MKTRKLTLALVFILLFALIASSCAASKSYGESDAMDNNLSFDKSESTMEPSAEDGGYDYGYDKDYDDSTSYSSTDSVGGIVTGDAQTMSEKIIRTVTMDAQTKEYDKAVSEIRAAVAAMGGFEETFRSTGKNYYSSNLYSRSAYMVLRIPAEQLDAFLSEVGGMINVLSQNLSANNVTGEYYDIQTRIGVLESERDAYEEMLKQSMDIEYLLKVKDRLYNVIEEIEAYQTQLKLLDSKVAYSTVTINLSEVVEYTPVVYEEPTFGQRVKDAFMTSWQNFGKACQNFAVWFVEALPTLLVLAVIAAVVIVVVVKLKRKHRRTVPAPKTDEPEKNDK